MRLRLALLVVFAVLGAAPSAFACACCGEPNQWLQYTDRVDAREVSRVHFASLAYLYGDADRVEGIP